MSDFTHYVAYNEYGGVHRRVEREWLEKLLETQEKKPNWYLMNVLWDLRREGDEIHARISPAFDLGAKVDNNWHSWNYTFVPEIL